MELSVTSPLLSAWWGGCIPSPVSAPVWHLFYLAIFRFTVDESLLFGTSDVYCITTLLFFLY